MVHKEMPQAMAWWFDSHNLAKPSSPWLAATLSAVDEKTKQMLELIDQDADSFAQRAEMYYKKRPVLVDMLGDLYRAHRSLAEQHDLLKLSSSGARRTTKFGPTSSCSSPPAPAIDGKGAAARSSTSSSSLCCSDHYDSESEVDDPEEEHAAEAGMEEEHHESELDLMRAEIERLKEEKEELQRAMEESAAALRDELAVKDEEKREVIRQLASCVDMVKEENRALRECVRSSKKKQHRSPSPPPSSRGFDLKKLTKDLFSAKIFGAHCKHSGPLVAL